MDNNEIKKLNKNIETLNNNIEHLLSKMSNPSIAMVAGPEVAGIMSSMQDMTGEVIPFNIREYAAKGIQMSVEQGVNVAKLMQTHAEFRSSCFSEVRYNQRTRQLTVCFRGNRSSKKEYTYANIDHSVYNDFISARSLGGFYAREIKGHYQTV